MDSIDITPIRAHLTLDMAGFRASMAEAEALLASGGGRFAALFAGLRSTASTGLTQIRAAFTGGFAAIRAAALAQWTPLRSWFTGAVAALVSTACGGVPGMTAAGFALYQGLLAGMRAAFEQVKAFVREANAWLADHTDGLNGAGAAGSHAGGLAFVPYDGYVAELHRGERVLTAEENRGYASSVNVRIAGGYDERALARRVRAEVAALMGVS